MDLLKRFWERWKRVARKIGDFQARLILGIFYFIILGPFSFLIKWSDPMGIRKKSPKGWLPKSTRPDSPMERALQQS
jgi:hypothetical protein